MRYTKLLETPQVSKIGRQLLQVVLVDLQLLQVLQFTHLIRQVKYFILHQIYFLQIHVEHVHSDELDVLFRDLELCLCRFLVHLVPLLDLTLVVGQMILSASSGLVHLFHDVDRCFPSKG